MEEKYGDIPNDPKHTGKKQQQSNDSKPQKHTYKTTETMKKAITTCPKIEFIWKERLETEHTGKKTPI